MGMGGYRIIAALVMSAPLAGCYGVTAQKPLPDWAMHQPVPISERLAAKPRVAAPPRDDVRQGAPTHTVSVAARRGTISDAPPVRVPAEIMPYTPEWQAQEDALDAKLRRRMHICNGC
jgi:hypothetical protein